MDNWLPPDKPAELTESRLIAAILDGTFPADSELPAERELAVRLGVTRPTLREALQRLARDGWLEIHQGKPTRVRNYLQEGNLAVLAAIAQHSESLPSDFVPNLLAVRILLAPSYARLAIEHDPDCIAGLLADNPALPDDAAAFSSFDWRVHLQLTLCSGNPVFTLILNGFKSLYQSMGLIYFAYPEAREHSRRFYSELLTCARKHDGQRAYDLTEQIMTESLENWKRTSDQ
jgi:GntR family transcriptional regulator, negative regulator for fad regulon and positive regulator of fabA